VTALNLVTALALLTTLGTVLGAPLSGRVVRVIDGDTVIVRSDDRTERRIRISGADAPERGQAHRAQSKRRAESLLLGRGVTVEPQRNDARERDGAISARVRVNGRDAAEPLIRDGAAWHERKSKQTPSERADYSRAQREAQERSRGLWTKDHPTEPRLLRERRHGREHR
jgi:endonuclease YncB( thermonuclease family)